MAINWQKGTLFAVGLAVGVAAGGWSVMSLRDGNQVQAPAAAPETRSMGAPAAAAPPPVLVAAPAGTCEQAPMLAKGNDRDGREILVTTAGTASESEVAGLILSGKEAVASGRPRDAEVAFLSACRKAAALDGKERIALADAMYQLGRHYANLAALGAPRGKELFERAERLYSASLDAYTARYGATHEKTRFAQGGLTTVLQATGGSGVAAVAKAVPPQPVVQPAPAPQPVVQAAPAKVPSLPAIQAPAVMAAAPAAPAPRSSAAVAAPAPAPKAAGTSPPPPVQVARAPEVAAPPAPVARRTAPSFDCAKARSTTEKLICADEDLARQDRELGALHQRAREAADDPRAFQRGSDAEWQRREDTCRDADCLRRWYAQRRQELGTAAAVPSQSRAPQTRPATAVEPPVAQVAPRPATPLRPRAPVREGQPEASAAPGTASGDAGVAPEPPPLRPRRAGPEPDTSVAPVAEGSPTAGQ